MSVDGAHHRLKVLGFEPFDAGSHRAVREALSRHSRHDWTWITRPGRNWKWRMRMAAVEMAGEVPAMGEWDAIVVTSLMSAADLRALLPVEMRGLPLILYMHENQAAYPESERTREDASGDRDVHFAMTNLTSALAADRVIWNSEWNRRSFLEGIEEVLRACSDLGLSTARLRERIEERSVVVWPPVDVPVEMLRDEGRPGAWAKPQAAGGGVLHNEQRPVRVVWPHRWEHDKGPDELLAIATRWSEELNLRWTILGERYGSVPAELIEFEKRFAPRIDHMGYMPDRAAYLAKLRECDWVLSTARHEFFGIAVVEAMFCGCLPWLPERLSYPELLPPLARGLSPVHPLSDPDVVRAAIHPHLSPAFAKNAARQVDDLLTRSVLEGR